MNCSELTNIITKVGEQFASFREVVPLRGQEKIDQALQVKKEINEILMKIDPVAQFYAQLNDPEILVKLAEINRLDRVKGWTGQYQENYDMISALFRVLDEDYVFFPNSFKNFDRRYGRFMGKLVEASNKGSGRRTPLDYIAPYLASIFLNLYMRLDSEVTIDGPWDRIPCLKKGKIRYKEQANGVGSGLQGAEIIVPESGNFTGNHMQSGIIRAQKTHEFAGNVMKGGKMYLGSATSHLGSHMEGGLIMADTATHDIAQKMEGGYVYIREIEDVTNVASSAKGGYVIVDGAQSGNFNPNNEFIYRHFGGKFYLHKGAAIAEIRDMQELAIFQNSGKSVSRIKGGALMQFEAANYLTTEMYGGILVIEDYSGTALGRGMKGGMIIIESTNLSVDQVRNCISKEGRTGGYILMRVPIPGKPGETHLIDLEDVTKEEGK